MEKRFVYADNAATTPMSETAFNAMKPWLTENYGNPSSLYRIGRAAKEALNDARTVVGKCLNAAEPVNEKNDYAPGEIVFTGGGSQADNLAIRGFMHGPSSKGRKHIITSKIEHHAVLSCLFGRIYQLPTLFYSHGCRNFNGYMLAMLHGVYCHGSVSQPVGTDEYEVNVIPFAHSFPSIRSGIAVRLRITGFPKYLLGFNQIAFPDFTKCFDFDTFDLQITLQSQYTSIAKPYESKAYHREWGMCQSEHMCLRRSFHV